MKVIRYTDPDFRAGLEGLAASSTLFDRTIEDRTREIIEAVQANGDQALIELTERFDRFKIGPDQLAVTQAEVLTATSAATDEFRRALKLAKANIEKFSRKALRKGWSIRNVQGAKVGEKYDPFERVGIYIPGGTAPLASTALMTIVLARVAGCPNIVVCTPGGRDGQINAALLYAVMTAGATEIYRVGGAQAIAAMAYGTESIGRVQKIFGPGNAYVVAAKRLVFGRVAVDLLPGPSEVLVLADETAEASFVAADLLAQAEHGSGHERVWLITTSGKLITGVQREIGDQLKRLSRRDLIQKALETNGCLVQVRRLEEGIAIVNRLAPEHCQVLTRRATAVAGKITTAGAIFVGPWSPTVLGDYVAGPSHTLPTGGAGASFAGLTVDQFQRRTSVVEYGQAALKKSLSVIREFSALEGLDAHGRSAEIRFEQKGRGKHGKKIGAD